MKKIVNLTILTLFFIVLTACGQSDAPISSNESSDGVKTEENKELTGSDLEDDSETAGTSTESPTESDSSDEPTPTVAEPTKTPVELFFADADVMNIYRVERQIEATDEELFEKTLQAWVKGPEQDDLVSLIPDNVLVQSVEEIEGVAHVSFSSELLDAQVGSGVEEMLLQQIAMTMKQFGFDETQILVDGEVVPELFGHFDTSVPIEADNPENYEKVK
ncbi:GerMN domain-containing protein [Halalkalibacter urbisdiaboli]|uniref:GerMN domain-containing protein n=1 Tax=Halalkalibacter urbisdiaboli TaxID=1960589 RepID=UPI000B43EC8D|nr:GerMN domain-containing protein [Halalkalibacter urbisdiaboli]